MKFLFLLVEGLAQAEGRKEPTSAPRGRVGSGDEGVLEGGLHSSTTVCTSFSVISTLDLQVRFCSGDGDDLGLLLLNLFLPGGGEEDCRGGTS